MFIKTVLRMHLYKSKQTGVHIIWPVHVSYDWTCWLGAGNKQTKQFPPRAFKNVTHGKYILCVCLISYISRNQTKEKQHISISSISPSLFYVIIYVSVKVVSYCWILFLSCLHFTNILHTCMYHIHVRNYLFIADCAALLHVSY